MYNKNVMPFLVCERPSFAMRKAVFHAPIDGLSHRKKPLFITRWLSIYYAAVHKSLT